MISLVHIMAKTIQPFYPVPTSKQQSPGAATVCFSSKTIPPRHSSVVTQPKVNIVQILEFFCGSTPIPSLGFVTNDIIGNANYSCAAEGQIDGASMYCLLLGKVQ